VLEAEYARETECDEGRRLIGLRGDAATLNRDEDD
jgi:hypothetical protein